MKSFLGKLFRHLATFYWSHCLPHTITEQRIMYCSVHQSSVDSSAPSILRSGVRIPSTPSTIFPYLVKFCTKLSLCWAKDKNKQKEAWVGPFLRRTNCRFLYNGTFDENYLLISFRFGSFPLIFKIFVFQRLSDCIALQRRYYSFEFNIINIL